MKEIAVGLMDEIVRRLVESLRPAEIDLFGSHARCTPHCHSDLDLLVVMPDDVGDQHDLTARAYVALAGLHAPIDLVVQCRREVDKWAAVKFSLPYEAIQKGKRVYAARVGIGA